MNELKTTTELDASIQATDLTAITNLTSAMINVSDAVVTNTTVTVNATPNQAVFATSNGIDWQKEARIQMMAECAYNVNRAYCQAIGDTSIAPWKDALSQTKEGYIKDVRSRLDNPLSPAGQHSLWMEHKIADGWKYGAIKDDENRLHPAMVAYDDLPQEQKVKDFLFQAVIDSLKGMK